MAHFSRVKDLKELKLVVGIQVGSIFHSWFLLTFGLVLSSLTSEDEGDLPTSISQVSNSGILLSTEYFCSLCCVTFTLA